MKRKLPHIAILEDDLFYAEYLKQGLKGMNYPIVTNFYTRQQLISNLKKDKPDLILLDHYLHDSLGLEVMDQIRILDEEAKIVYVSGQDSPTVALNALKKGALDYLEKDDKVFEHLKKIILKVRKDKKRIQLRKEMETKMKWLLGISLTLLALIIYMMKNY